LMELTGYTTAQLLQQEYLLVCCSTSSADGTSHILSTTRGDV
jgi:hypothetical protein